MERAFELARSGAYFRSDDIARRLVTEGYEDVRAQLGSPTLRKQLNQLCKDACAPDAA